MAFNSTTCMCVECEVDMKMDKVKLSQYLHAERLSKAKERRDNA